MLATLATLLDLSTEDRQGQSSDNGAMIHILTISKCCGPIRRTEGFDMSETLSQKQRRFARMVARLIDQAHELGFEVSLGDAYRDPRVHGQFG